MIFKLPDGHVVEVIMCGAVNGPDQVGGLHYGTSYPYYRVDSGAWKFFGNGRSQHRIYEWLGCCETLADFYELEPR